MQGVWRRGGVYCRRHPLVALGLILFPNIFSEDLDQNYNEQVVKQAPEKMVYPWDRRSTAASGIMRNTNAELDAYTVNSPLHCRPERVTSAPSGPPFPFPSPLLRRIYMSWLRQR